MSKAIMISIKPKWCELIACGKKTVEVRKTRPKLKTPFKCYIYCTKDKSDICNVGNGKVIGEFICDGITMLKAGNMIQAYYNNTKNTCLSDLEIVKYANGKPLYYYHISDLKVYDEPKKIDKFFNYLPDEILHRGDYDCRGIGAVFCMDMPEGSSDCADCEFGGRIYFKRPPQSWCYVEEVQK